MVIYFHESAPFSAEKGKGKNTRTVWYRTVSYLTNKGKKNAVNRRVKTRNKDQYFAKGMKNMTIVDGENAARRELVRMRGGDPDKLHSYTKRIHHSDGTVEEKKVLRRPNYKKHKHSNKK